MNVEAHGTYSDCLGDEPVSFHLTGDQIQTSIRGCSFLGRDFDSLVPELPEVTKGSFENIESGFLSDFTLNIRVPIRSRNFQGIGEALLLVKIVLGKAQADSSLSSVELELSLKTASNGSFQSSSRKPYFEDQMISIVSQLPDYLDLECCFTCGLSDYSPYGNGTFGDLICFKDKSESYLRVSSKRDLIEILHGEEPRLQETFLCDSFQKRIKDTGYRG